MISSYSIIRHLFTNGTEILIECQKTTFIRIFLYTFEEFQYYKSSLMNTMACSNNEKYIPWKDKDNHKLQSYHYKRMNTIIVCFTHTYFWISTSTMPEGYGLTIGFALYFCTCESHLQQNECLQVISGYYIRSNNNM